MQIYFNFFFFPSPPLLVLTANSWYSPFSLFQAADGMDPSTETEESIAGGENSQRAADSQNCGTINWMFSVIVYACLKEANLFGQVIH